MSVEGAGNMEVVRDKSFEPVSVGIGFGFGSGTGDRNVGAGREEATLGSEESNIDVITLGGLVEKLRDTIVKVLAHSIELLLLVESDNGNLAANLKGHGLSLIGGHGGSLWSNEVNDGEGKNLGNSEHGWGCY